MCYSSFLTLVGSDVLLVKVSQYLQNQSTERMELLNKRMENEAVLARIFTNIALVYLPGSFVSVSCSESEMEIIAQRLTSYIQSFFSTDVVKYQGQEKPEGAFSRVALERWLEVTIPLTILSFLLVWWNQAWLERPRSEREQSVSGMQRQRSSGAKGPSPSNVSAIMSVVSQLPSWWRVKLPSRRREEADFPMGDIDP
jgi:hypothetical protein